MNRFQLIRKILKMSQLEVAKVLRTTDRFWSYLETGIRKPSKQTLYVLEKELGISREWLETGQGVIFSDSEKGLNYIFKKDSLTVDELFFLLNLMQYVYSHIDFIFSDIFSNEKFPVRKDFCLTLLNLARNFGLENIKGYTLERIEKFIESEDAGTTELCDEFVAYLINYVSERDFSLSEREIDLLNQNLLPWSYYVAKAAVEYEKRQLKPVSSAFIDVDVKELDKYLSFEVEKFSFTNLNAVLSFNYSFIILNLESKMLIEIEKEKFFALIALFERAKVDQTLKILDFELFYNKKTSHLKQKNLSVVLSIEEFEQIKSLFSKVKENKNVYNHLQACYVERYGFV